MLTSLLQATADKFLINATTNAQFDHELPKLIHRCLTEDILSTAGAYRTVNVHVANSSFKNPSHEDVPRLMAKFMDELIENLGKNLTLLYCFFPLLFYLLR